MNRQIYIILLLLLTGCTTSRQIPPCEELAKQMIADSTKAIWEYDSLSPETYFCLGKYFAQRDLDNKIFKIQTFGYPSYENPCSDCNYEFYGFKFEHQGDANWEGRSEYSEGYNETSLSYLKKKIGDSAFKHLDDIPEHYFNPKAVILENFGKGENPKLYIIDIINDTTINVKLMVDSIFKDFPLLLEKIVYHVSDYDFKNRKAGEVKVLNFAQIRETGIRLTESTKDKYYLKIDFDFRSLVDQEKYCWCALLDPKEYSYLIPLIVRK